VLFKSIIITTNASPLDTVYCFVFKWWDRCVWNSPL